MLQESREIEREITTLLLNNISTENLKRFIESIMRFSEKTFFKDLADFFE